jgi:hypothetical protein
MVTDVHQPQCMQVMHDIRASREAYTPWLTEQVTMLQETLERLAFAQGVTLPSASTCSPRVCLA